MRRGKGRPLVPGDFKAYENTPMTQELARRLWTYDPETGDFFWNGSPRQGVFKGDKTGVVGFHGYRILCFYGKKYKCSRIAFLMMVGRYPVGIAEHKNADRADDRWENLREATQSQNMCNKSTMSNNKLGLKGVSQGPDGKYYAYICLHGKRKNLGGFSSPELAKSAYDTAAKEWHGELARAA